jgi:hypothetical protein
MGRYSTRPDVCWIPPSVQSTVWHIGTSSDFRKEEERVVRYRLTGLPGVAPAGA